MKVNNLTNYNKKILVCLTVLMCMSCEIYGSGGYSYAPYRPDLGGHYEFHYEICPSTMPYAVESALICDEACCIWATQGFYSGAVCEETWCCDSYTCEWFLHYEDCY